MSLSIGLVKCDTERKSCVVGMISIQIFQKWWPSMYEISDYLMMSDVCDSQVIVAAGNQKRFCRGSSCLFHSKLIKGKYVNFITLCFYSSRWFSVLQMHQSLTWSLSILIFHGFSLIVNIKLLEYWSFLLLSRSPNPL